MTSFTFQAYKWELETLEPENDSDSPTTVIYIHGLTKKNRTITVKVPDFKPYVYIELPSEVKWTNNNLNIFNGYLKKMLHSNSPVKKKFVEKNKIYFTVPTKFLWCAFNTTDAIRHLERILAKPITIYGLYKNEVKFTVHENGISPILQLHATQKLKPAGWITATTDEDSLIGCNSEQFSTSHYELVTSYKNLKPENLDLITDPKIMSFDIECVSGDTTGMTFPDPKKHDCPVICISATVGRYSDPPEKWQIYCLVNAEGNRKVESRTDFESADADTKGVTHPFQVRNFDDEKSLLLGFTDFVNEIDPDVIVSYNGLSFDENYLAIRASNLRIYPKFSKMGRLIGKPTKLEERKWNSSAYGDQKFNFMAIAGRLHIDMYPVISKDFTTLPSYKLDFVSEEFLKENKVDLPARDMIQMYHIGGSENMTKIVEYCNQDTLLPFKLMKRLNSWIGLVENSNVMLVQIFDLITRGQQIRVFSQIYCHVFDKNYVCNSKLTDYKPTDTEKEFVGATVQNPLTGYWEGVSCFDFCSMYPHSIIAYNLCFSTFVPESENPSEELYHKLEIPSHVGCEHDKAIRKTKVKKIICKDEIYRFYKATYRKGVLPEILENTLNARKNTRDQIKKLETQMKEINDEDKKTEMKVLLSMLDKRQNGYKISANSSYGSLGSDYSKLPFYPAAAATTAMGRFSIENAINYTKEHNDDTVIVYGDSVTGDTPILLKINGEIKRIPINEIGGGGSNWETTESFKNVFLEPVPSKYEYFVDTPEEILATRYLFNNQTRKYKERKTIEGIEVWSSEGWTPVKQVIRHFTTKKIYKITTESGEVKVTQDHSLLTKDLKEIKPVNVDIGTELFHSSPYELCSNWSKCKITKIEVLGVINDYVYDLETVTGNFQAGIGNIIVKNTDSCFIHFKNTKTPKELFERCHKLEKEINTIFPKPMKLELEKIYKRFFLLSKKRYIGEIMDDTGEVVKTDKKGVVVKRRDNCETLRRVYNSLIKMIMTQQPKWIVYQMLSKEIGKMLSGVLPIEEFTITKSIKDTYKGIYTCEKCGKKSKVTTCTECKNEMTEELNFSVNLPHVCVAKKMRQRGKYVVSGTRVQYVFVKTENPKEPQYAKAEDPEYVIEKGLDLDYRYYLEKQLVNPIDEVLEVRFGIKNVLGNLNKLLIKGEIKNVEDYFKPKFRVES